MHTFRPPSLSNPALLPELLIVIPLLTRHSGILFAFFVTLYELHSSQHRFGRFATAPIWHFRIIGRSYIWSVSDSKYKSSELNALKYALEGITSGLVSDEEVGTGDALVLMTNGIADLLVFGLLDGGLVGLRHDGNQCKLSC